MELSEYLILDQPCSTKRELGQESEGPIEEFKVTSGSGSGSGSRSVDKRV